MRMLLQRKAVVSNFVSKSLADSRFLTERIRSSEFEAHPCSPPGSTYCLNCPKPSSNDVSRSLRDNNLDPMHGCTLLFYFATLCYATWIQPNLTVWWIRTYSKWRSVFVCALEVFRLSTMSMLCGYRPIHVVRQGQSPVSVKGQSQVSQRSVTGQSQVSHRSVTGQSQVSQRSVKGQSQVSQRSVTGQSKISHRSVRLKGQSQVSQRSVTGQSRVSHRLVKGQSKVSQRSVTGQSKVSHRPVNWQCKALGRKNQFKWNRKVIEPVEFNKFTSRRHHSYVRRQNAGRLRPVNILVIPAKAYSQSCRI